MPGLFGVPEVLSGPLVDGLDERFQLGSEEWFFGVAGRVAEGATCLQARCGSVLVDAGGRVIGSGFNAPPLGLESQRKCGLPVDVGVKPKSDKTCCVHAEWNAVLDGLRFDADAVRGSTLFFMRVDEFGGFTEAGDPYCSVCSRLTLEAGVSMFGLWNGGPELWDAESYNLRSYEFFS